MHRREQEERQLLAYFRRMADKDRKAALRFFAASVRDNERSAPALKLITGGRTAAA